MSKKDEAWKIVHACFGVNGVWADPTRYRYQCWTRDLALAIQPLLLDSGHEKMARTHLKNLTEHVRSNGRVPILYLDDVQGFLDEKERLARERGREGFMLKRFREGQLWNLTPGTKDSEILYLWAMADYAAQTGDDSLLVGSRRTIENVRSYVERELERDGLVYGADWRDTMEAELADKSLLTNNAMWIAALELMCPDGSDHAARVRERVLATHYAPDLLDDYPGRLRFDPLGASLAVLHDVVDQQHYATVLKGFRSVDSEYGVTIHCKHNPLNAEEAKVIVRTDGQVVWPFIVGFSVLALRKMGSPMAEEQFEKLEAMQGFREWYDPATGQGYGAEQQLWSATLYLRALEAMI